jgi:uncharacterized protein (TIGR03435 family)
MAKSRKQAAAPDRALMFQVGDKVIPQRPLAIYAITRVAALIMPLAVGGIVTRAVQAQTRQVAVLSSPPISATFEVASVRPNENMRQLNTVELNLLEAVGKGSSHGRFRMVGVPVTVLIELAYNLKDFQVVGSPSWANSDGYDISAKAEGDATFEQMRPMLQSLLADRFKLILQRETKELPVYELGVAKGGLKMVATKEGSCVSLNPDSPPAPPKPGHFPAPLNICRGIRRQVVSVAPERVERIEAIGISMTTLVEMLSNDVGRTVIDKTGLTEPFDVHLNFAHDRANTDDPGTTPLDPTGLAPSANLSAPSIFTHCRNNWACDCNRPTRRSTYL